MRVIVYLKPKTILLLLARRNADLGWLAERTGVSRTTVSFWMHGKSQPSNEARTRIMEAFRGMSHKPGGRLKWDDIFQSVFVDSGASL